MDKQMQCEMIARLSEANGASGFEDEVLEVLREYGEGLGTWQEDSMRNLTLRREGNSGGKPTVLLDAHTDEVGFMVQSITQGGMLKFVPLGGWIGSNIPAHKVRVRTADGGYIRGITSSKPPHFATEAERRAVPAIEDMQVDIGATSRKEAQELFGARIGEPVVPHASFEYIEANGTMVGKAFDNRLGCAALLATLDALRGEALMVDVVAGFVTQEELGLRGARVVANDVMPDLAIVFEGCPADDTFTAEGQCMLKKGPMLRHIDSSMLANPRLLRWALELAGEQGIPVQEAVRSSGGTNAGAIHLAGKGVPVIVIGVPVRYIHTHYGIAAMEDYLDCVRLACALLRVVDAGRIEGL